MNRLIKTALFFVGFAGSGKATVPARSHTPDGLEQLGFIWYHHHRSRGEGERGLYGRQPEKPWLAIHYCGHPMVGAIQPKSHGYRPDADLAMDANGRLIPAPNRFPSSANGQGFKPLADYVHSKGLKFGIHIMRGHSADSRGCESAYRRQQP